jgi:hypothetical protein
MGKLYTPKEFAKFRRCSEKTLERERAAGTGCPYALLGRQILYREEDIERFVAERVRCSTSDPTVAAAGEPSVLQRRPRDHSGQHLHNEPSTEGREDLE